MMLLFADLHCSPKTLDICLEVLRDIHARALKEKCSIGFLGDFFDTVYRRGTIPVDMLNTLLDFFAREWCVNTWMIPGNHDYIDASETEHALEPFGLCNHSIRIINEPTVIESVLWVPWKRDNDLLRQIFKKFQGNYKTIFGHFDVIGACVNNNTSSDRGLNKEDFPAPVISGHYHKPQHLWEHVTYIGSPYQTSMGEAGQQKYFVKYYTAQYRYTRIPVSFGPKRYKVTENPETWPVKELKQHDILYMDTFNPDKLTQEAEDYVRRLKRIGVIVVLQRFLKETVSANSLLDTEKELSAKEMFKLYGEHFNLVEKPGYDKTLKMIDTISSSISDLNQTPLFLEFESISFEGFGPFKKKQVINLKSRGLSKITGVWEEGSIGSSNGAGKSMASVSAFLWCLTGYSDMRACTTLKKSQSSAACVNHETKQSRVELIGNLGGACFKIYRSSSLQDKTNFLEVHLNNRRITRSTQYQTQYLINQTFFRIPKGKILPKAPNKRLHAWLMRTFVWEQSGGGKKWLEMNDKGTKEELLLLCNMNIWEEMDESIKTKLMFVESNNESMKKLLNNAIKNLENKEKSYQNCITRKEKWIYEQRLKLNKLREKVSIKLKEMEDLGPQPIISKMPINPNKRKHEEISRNYFNAQQKTNDSLYKVQKLYKCKTFDELTDAYDFDVDKTPYDAPDIPSQLLDNAIAESAIRKQQLGLLLRVASQPTSCPTCKQSLCVEHVEPERIEAAKTEVGNTNNVVRKIKQKIQVHERAVKEEEKRKTRLTSFNEWTASKIIYKQNKKNYEDMKKIQDDFEYSKTEWSAQRIVLQEWESKKANILEVLRLIQAQLDDENEMTCPVLSEEKMLNQEIKNNKQAIEKYANSIEKSTVEYEELINMKNWVGHKGIQTYVVERMLHKMSKHTTDWCRRLFDIESQGSPSFKMELDVNENISKELTFGDNSNAHALSGGQYRRLQIASFMAWRIQSSIFTGIHCNLSLLDEPASNIDVVGFRQMEEAVKDWCQMDKNRTCIFISHDVNSNKDSSIYDTHIEIRAKPGNSIVFDYDTK